MLVDDAKNCREMLMWFINENEEKWKDKRVERRKEKKKLIFNFLPPHLPYNQKMPTRTWEGQKISREKDYNAQRKANELSNKEEIAWVVESSDSTLKIMSSSPLEDGLYTWPCWVCLSQPMGLLYSPKMKELPNKEAKHCG